MVIVGEASTTKVLHHLLRPQCRRSTERLQVVVYSVIDAPERIRLAHRLEQRSRKAVKGYIEDVCTEVENDSDVALTCP